ncbi:MAG: hypothetical protein J5365_00765, partial [Erysipelotrichaceae bacterium]|nr:hypothetical protein [Erysipelotrichaceae bacterium]
MKKENETIWKILGIDETRDRKQITEAYRDRLSDVNPEDKPEEFKQLRGAYEEALAFAERSKGKQGTDQEIQEWMKDLEDLYEDFSKRKNVACWEELFSQEICQNISGHMKIEEELLHYLMDHYSIGHDVWLCMDRHFSFMERKDELYERYPREFIDRVIINGILYPDILPMELFVPGENGEECQKYLDTYLDAGLDENCANQIETLEGLSESHPYGDALIYSWKARFVDPKYISDLEELTKKYEDDLNLTLMLGREYYVSGNYEKAEELCRKWMEDHKDVIRLRSFYADVLEAQEKYDDAMKEINAMMSMAEGDSRMLNDLNERRKKMNPFIIENKIQVLKEDPDDEQAKVDLCWAYLENERDEEAAEVFQTINKDSTPAFDYY